MGETARGAAGRIPAGGRSCAGTGQRENREAILRQSALLVGSDVSEQRRLLRALVSAQPLSAC
jgi:lipoate-protein ligase A